MTGGNVSQAVTSSYFGDIRRGDYINAGPMSQYAETTSGLARGEDAPAHNGRVTVATATTLTFRDVRPNRLREWLHARAEDWLLWPFADVATRIREWMK